MKVNFITPTRISLIDITSMGDSSKRGNDSTIGQFDSGLKYAIALLLRNNIKMSIHVQGEPKIHENWEEPTTEHYTFSTYIEECENTGKSKELIQVVCLNTPHGGECMNQYDMREPSGEESWIVNTGFAKALGYNWELWMALRELWSNMLDEGGEIGEYFIEDGIQGTVITIEFDDNSEFAKVWENKHLYINQEEPLFKINDSVEALKNDEGFLRIYKQNILVYKDENIPSKFAYNVKYGEIDERRVLSNLWSVQSNITDAIMYTSNEAYLRQIITKEYPFKDKEFLKSQSVYVSGSELAHKIALEVFNEHGEVDSYSWLMNAIKSRKDCQIGGKVIKSIGDSIYNYSKNVTVESKPIDFCEPSIIVEDIEYVDPFVSEIKKHFNFNLDVHVKKACLSGSKVIADKFQKCLIISDDFDILEDMPEFIVQYFDLTKEGNVIKNLSVYICELLRK